VGEPSAFHGAPRRIEALAYIVERIERTGTSPSYGEIGRGMRPHVTGSRVRQLVDQLVRIGVIERDVASRHPHPRRAPVPRPDRRRARAAWLESCPPAGQS